MEDQKDKNQLPDDPHYKVVNGKYRVKKKKSELEKRFTEEEEQALLNSFTFENHKNYALRNKSIIEFLLNTGLRVAEFAALKVSDVLGMNAKVKSILDVRPETAKRSKARQVPLNSVAQQAVRNLLLGRDGATYNDPLTVTLAGEKLSRRAIQEVVKISCLKAGITRLCGPHLCRHHFLSKVYDKCQNIKVVQTLAGHSSPTLSISLYCHTSLDSMREVCESITGNQNDDSSGGK